MTKLEKILSLSHLPTKAIAEQTDIGHHYVLQVLREAGVKYDKITRKERILSMKDTPVEEIAKKLHTSTKYVKAVLSREPESEYFTHDPYYNF